MAHHAPNLCGPNLTSVRITSELHSARIYPLGLVAKGTGGGPDPADPFQLTGRGGGGGPRAATAAPSAGAIALARSANPYFRFASPAARAPAATCSPCLS